MLAKNSLQSITTRALYESLGVDMITKIAGMVIADYDIHKQTGYPATVPIPSQNVAKQLVEDVMKEGLFLELVEALIHLDRDGYYSRRYPIAYLREIVMTILDDGYIYENKTGVFMEDSRRRCTPNWSRLKEGEESQFAFLRVDIVKNSQVVLMNEKKIVDKAYEKLRDIISIACKKHHGRLWFWEGDGGIAAFYFGTKNTEAVLSGMEILHEVFWYNHTQLELSAPLSVRMAAHAGLARYYNTESELRRNETIKEIIDVESTYTRPDTLAVTPNIFLSLDRVLVERFTTEKSAGDWRLSTYSVKMEP